MAISDRIQSIEEHIKESYQELEGIGIDTTEVDKNLENIPKLIDGYWETLPKVTEEGTSITLDNTKEGKMKINLKGNTSQETTTGKNIWNLGSLSGTTQAGITLKQDTDGGFLLNGTSTGVGRFKITLNTDINETITLYLKSFNNSGDIMISLRDTNDVQLISMRNDNVLKVYSYTPTAPIRYIELIQLTSGVQYTNYKIYPMIVKGSYTSSTIGEYEPYTNGASPNPDYPQEIHVVSGDNEIKVEGKNLINIENSNIHLLTNWDGTTVIHNSYNSMIVDTRNKSSITISGDFTNIENGGIRYGLYTQYPSTSTTGIRNNLPASGTINTTNANYILLSFQPATNKTFANIQNSIQVEYGSTATEYEAYKGASYPINLGNIELCKIGDYQDSIKKSTGKNLCNTVFELGGIDTTTGQNGSGADRVRTKDYVKIQPNTTYTLSGVQGSRVACFYNSSKAYLSYTVVDSQSTSGTFITPNDASYIRWYIIQTDTNINEMLNEGSTVLPYEPYGKVWYLHKEIKKKVLNGIETWTYTSVTQGSLFRTSNTVTDHLKNDTYSPYSNYYKGIPAGTVSQRKNNQFYIQTNFNYLDVIDNRYTNANDFKNWILSNNVTIYYILATPTTTEITDSTLLSQLEALNGAKSYTIQTNINQENNDNASILNASALSE